MNQHLKKIKNKVQKSNFLIGSVQEVFCGLRFRSNRFKHSVKRFDRFGLATLTGMVVIISTYHALNKNLLLFRQRHQGLHHLKEALGKDPFCGRFQSFDQLTAFIILFSKSSFSTFHRGVAELKQLQG